MGSFVRRILRGDTEATGAGVLAPERDDLRSVRRFAARRRWLAGIAGALCAFPAFGAGALRTPWPRARPTPPIELPGLDGALWTPESARGRPLLLNFWASWCEPCRAEIPSLEALALRHEGDGLIVMAVNYRENEATVKRFVEATSLRLPVLFDRRGEAAKQFGIHAFPSSVIIDRRGHAASVVVGECDWGAAPARDWIAATLS